jgi:hypothetical protein
METLERQKEQWELLYDHAKSRQYGEIISHHDIEKIIGENHGSQKYKTVIDKAKWELLSAGYTFKNVRGKGYRVLEPDEYTDYSLDYMQKGLSSIEKSDKIQRYAPINKMSPEQQRIHREVSDRTAVLKAHMIGANIEIKLLSKNN